MGYPVDEHFKPAYNPWDQRLCVVPDGDLFKAISDGHASVVTDRITPSPSGASVGIRARTRRRHHRDRHRPEPSGVRWRDDDRGRSNGERGRQGGIRASCSTAFPTSRSPSATPTRPGLSRSAWWVITSAGCWPIWTPMVTPSVIPQSTTRRWSLGPLVVSNSGYVQRSIHQFPRQGRRTLADFQRPPRQHQDIPPRSSCRREPAVRFGPRFIPDGRRGRRNQRIADRPGRCVRCMRRGRDRCGR